MSKLFGTDGVRGTAGTYPLDHRTVARIGAALVRALPHETAAARLLVGRDTRESGVWIEQELARGVHSEGATLTSAGVIPTPAIAHLTKAHGFDAGVVISASHNPYQDNGIKVFSGRGEKFGEALEAAVEGIVADESWQVPDEPLRPVPVRPSTGSGRAELVEGRDFIESYLDHAALALPRPERLGPLRIAIDCANGATTTVVPRLLRRFGFDVAVIGDRPDGRNINLNCGSTHPETLAAIVAGGSFRLGVAFDGDGDRAIFVDHTGRVVDGDAVMFICAKQMHATGQLKGGVVVATVMSNIGLELALRAAGIDLVRCPVGDKYVMEELIRRELSLGGEQSGHVIFSEHLFTGDGLVTALAVLRIMAETGRELADLAADLRTYPQVLLNVRVRQKLDLRQVTPVADAMARVEERLAGHGRLLVRYSGTEPLLRVMIEGQDLDEIHLWAEEIVTEVKKAIG
jgi:phosphoglucosamine mutase